MNKFRKKSIIIEAVQLLDSRHSVKECISFIDKKPDLSKSSDDMRFDDFCYQVFEHGIKISTLEGEMTASIGDWIIKGINGEFYPCKPDIFEKTYKKVDSDFIIEFKTIEELIKEQNSFISAIPNNLGINLCSVQGIEYERQADGQLNKLTIIFIPE